MTARSTSDEHPHALIGVRDRKAVVHDSGLRVETDLQVPGTSFGRWVFHAPRHAPWTSRPHSHDYPHVFLCLRGQCRLAYGPAGGSPRRVLLAVGAEQHVPASVAHQIMLDPGAVVASFVPHVTWLRRPEVQDLDGVEWFPCD